MCPSDREKYFYNIGIYIYYNIDKSEGINNIILYIGTS